MAEDTAMIDELVARSRAAQASYEAMGSQGLFDRMRAMVENISNVRRRVACAA